MSAVFIKLFNMSITASWLVLAVILLRILLKKAPKWIRGILWSIVAIRLLIPVSIESILSLIPSANTIPENITVVQKPVIHTGFSALNSSVNPIISETMAPTDRSNGTTPMQELADILCVVWLCGIILMTLYCVFSYIRIYRRTREHLELGDNVFCCDRVESPFIFGIIRAKIYLPSNISEDDREYIIAHERAHIKRHDHIWKPFAFLLLSVYWFNPVMWIAYILLSRDIELACDEKVIKQMGEESKRSYSNALINCSVRQRYITACPVAFGEVGVKGRIKSVLNYKKPAFWIIIVAIIACIALTVFFLTDPKEESTVMGKENIKLEVAELIYSDGSYSFIQYPESVSPFYITKDMELLEEDSFGGIREYGQLKEIEFNNEKFDSRFVEDWFPEKKEIKDNNERIWEVYGEERNGTYELVIILEQQDGSFYLGYGYYRNGPDEVLKSDTNEGFKVYEGAKGQNPDRSHIRWLYKMDKSEGTAKDRSADNPTFEATVLDVTDEKILIRVSEGYEKYISGDVYMPNDYTMSGEPMPSLKPDDRIKVIFNGTIYDEEIPEIYEVYSVTVTESSDGTQQVEALGPVNAEIYMYHGSPDYMSPTIRLSKDDNTFSFTYSLLSSYLCSGTYERNDKELILKTGDGVNEYRFERDGECYIFDAKNSSEIPDYKYGSEETPESPVPDGAVFESKATLLPPYDSIKSDIDNDSKEEECYLTVGPTSGIFSFYFSVYEDGILEYHDLMTPFNYSDVSFHEDESGKLYLKAKGMDEEGLWDIEIENGHIYLYEDGIEPGISDFDYKAEEKEFSGKVYTKNIDYTEKDESRILKKAVEAIEFAKKEIGDENEVSYYAFDRNERVWYIQFSSSRDEQDMEGTRVYISAEANWITVVSK